MKIPHLLDNQIMVMHADGKNSTQIIEALKLSCSDSLLRKRITDIRKARAEVIGSKVLVKLEGKVDADLDYLDGIIKRALEDELKARAVAWSENQTMPDGKVISVRDEKGELTTPRTIVGGETWARLMNVVKTSRADLVNAIETRLELAGATGGEKKPVTEETRNKLMDKLDILLDQAIQKIPQVKGPPDLKVVQS